MCGMTVGPAETGPRRRSLPFVAQATFVVVGVLVLCAGVYRARGALVLIFLGAFVAISLEPVVRRLMARGWGRGRAIAVMMLAALTGLAVLIVFVTIPACREVGHLVTELPDRLRDLSDNIGADNTTTGDYLQSDETAVSYQESVQRAARLAVTAASGIFGIAGSILGFGLTIFSIVAVGVYVSMSLPRLHAGAARLLGSEARVATMDEALEKVSGYVIGQSLICLIAGTTSFVFFHLVGMPYPALLALVVMALDAIPQVGATLASVVGVAVALTVSLPLAIGVLVFFVIYQQLENYLVAPRVFSKTVQISPLAAFVAVLIGASIAGVFGAILALPVTGALTVVLRQVLAERAGAQTPDPAPAPTPAS